MATSAKDKAERFLVSIIIHRFGMAFFYVILLCGDVALNPGPMKWPCTVCGKCVKSNDRALLCDLCDNWSHTRCVGVSEVRYQELCEVSDDFNWHCPSCLFKQLPCSDVIDDVFNPCDSLSDSVSSSDSCTTNSHSLSYICLNSWSIINKVLDFEALIATDSPDIVAVTKTFLDCSISDCEFFPKGFQLFRCDRSRHGGGVMIAMRESVPSIHRFDLENPDIELLWL